jgi:hypothetical protein
MVNRGKRSGLVVALATLSIVGCSSSISSTASTPAQDVNDICTKIVSCGFTDSTGSQETLESCLSNHNGWIPPTACRSLVDADTCGQLEASTGTVSAYIQACFPPCTNTPTTCSGDNLVECTPAGQTVTTTCVAKCAATSSTPTYSGVCGATDQGKQSSTGGPVCWCH